MRAVSILAGARRGFSTSRLSAAGAASAAGIPSFSRGLFLGSLDTSSLHPYPVKDVLSAETKETLSMLVEPAQKFFAEVNDAAKNDVDAEVPAAVLQQLKDLGAFGLQVPEELEGAGLTNTGYA